jgi:hypothetical protein
LEVDMAITLRKGREKAKRIEVEGEWEKEEEVIVHHEIVFPKWKTWSYANFSRYRNKNDFVQKKEINLTSGE